MDLVGCPGRRIWSLPRISRCGDSRFSNPSSFNCLKGRLDFSSTKFDSWSHVEVALINIFLCSQGSKSTKRSEVEAIFELPSLNFFEKLGDWLVLHLVCKNLNELLINDLIKQLHKDASAQDFGDNSDTLPLKPESKKNPQLSSSSCTKY